MHTSSASTLNHHLCIHQALAVPSPYTLYTLSPSYAHILRPNTHSHPSLYKYSLGLIGTITPQRLYSYSLCISEYTWDSPHTSALSLDYPGQSNYYKPPQLFIWRGYVVNIRVVPVSAASCTILYDHSVEPGTHFLY